MKKGRKPRPGQIRAKIISQVFLFNWLFGMSIGIYVAYMYVPMDIPTYVNIPT
jgi:hypothetical protein